MNGTHGATLTAPPGWRARYPWLGPALLLALLIFITVNVVANGPLTSLDHSIGHAIQSVAHRRSLRWVRHGHTTPARLIIDLGAFAVALPLLGLAAIVAAVRQRGPRPLIAAAVGAVTTLGCIYAGKKLVHQLAPRQVILGHTGGSFPSGHMTTACVCYFLIVVLLLPAGSWRRAGMIAATVLCALIGASLLWCDLHWFSDVAGGAVLSALLVMLAAWVNRPPAAGSPAGPPVRPETTALDQAGR
jgi:membrane-associated phospholipid phosphatase